jgi:hypothetical protein
VSFSNWSSICHSPLPQHQCVDDLVTHRHHQCPLDMDRSWIWHPPTYFAASFGIHRISSCLFLGCECKCTSAILSKLTFFVGVPSAEILRVSQLLATKLIENEFAAYLGLPWHYYIGMWLILNYCRATKRPRKRESLVTACLHYYVVFPLWVCKPRIARYPDRCA